MPETRTLNYGGAVNQALRMTLAADPTVILFGEDVAKPGGVFGVTRGLHREFGERVMDTPISETAMLGAALGAAMMGMRPIVEIMWADFTLVALDQVVNQIANTSYVSQGKLRPSLVIRTQQGNSAGACAQHSQCLEAFFLHVPGLRVAMPSTAQDAFDVLLAATACNDPVLVIENRTLYLGPKSEVVVEPTLAGIGGSLHRRRGDDVTVVTWGAMTRVVERAVDALASELDVQADVIETHWLNPFDWDGVLESVRRTRRLVVVHEANRTGGFGAEVVARVVESGTVLRAAPIRVALPDVPMPAAPSLVGALMPDEVAIVSALRNVLG